MAKGGWRRLGGAMYQSSRFDNRRGREEEKMGGIKIEELEFQPIPKAIPTGAVCYGVAFALPKTQIPTHTYSIPRRQIPYLP
jgi:hypothetical protein